MEIPHSAIHSNRLLER